jgi:hypothetical protein
MTLVSVVLPSRKRPEQLLYSMCTLLDKAFDSSDVEFVIGYDSDDPETREAAMSASLDSHMNVKIKEFERLGYHRLHEYVNTLCAEADGEWLFLWNDDAHMLTNDWDCEIRTVDGKRYPIILTFDDTQQANIPNHTGPHQCCFPLLNKGLFDHWGHFSLSNHCDAWLQDGSRRGNLNTDLPIHIHHDRFDVSGNNNDEVYQEGQQGYRIAEYLSNEMQAKLNEDVASAVRWVGR